jgi:hypothetical protein
MRGGDLLNPNPLQIPRPRPTLREIVTALKDEHALCKDERWQGVRYATSPAPAAAPENSIAVTLICARCSVVGYIVTDASDLESA